MGLARLARFVPLLFRGARFHLIVLEGMETAVVLACSTEKPSHSLREVPIHK